MIDRVAVKRVNANACSDRAERVGKEGWIEEMGHVFSPFHALCPPSESQQPVFFFLFFFFLGGGGAREMFGGFFFKRGQVLVREWKERKENRGGAFELNKKKNSLS